MVQEAHKIKILGELEGVQLEDLLHEMARSREPLAVVIKKGESLTIEPVSQLKLLPRLDGRVPEMWKDAV